MAYSTKKDRDKAAKETPENVRMREGAAARCTKVIKRRSLNKQASESQTRSPGKMQFDAREKPLTELYVNGDFTEDRE